MLRVFVRLDAAAMPTFECKTVISATMQQVIAFHDDPRVFGWLVPPPIRMRIHKDTRSSLTAGDIDFTLWFLLLPVHWIARHEPGPTEHSFQDRMIEGPMRSWLHQHIFREVEGGVELADRVTYEHKSGLWGVFTRLAFSGLALRFLFFYRHWQTRRLAPRLTAPQAPPS